MDIESDAGVETTIEEGSELEAEGVETDDSLSSEESNEDDTVDWKAIAQKEREEKENLKKALVQKRQLRNKKTPVIEPEEDDDEEEDEDSRPVTASDIRKIVTEAVQVASAPSVDTILASMVKDPSKREAVKAIYEGSIRQTGTSDAAIRADLTNAIDLADSKANRIKASEVARKANQPKVPSLAGSGADKGKDPSPHKFSDEQVKRLTASAKAIGADPATFIANAWKNASGLK